MKRFYHTIIVCTIVCAISGSPLFGQGCVGIRSVAGNMAVQGSALLDKGDMDFSLNYRYFKSYKHFVGDVEQFERVEEETNVINHVHAFDLVYTYGLNKQWNISADVPIIDNTRSQLASNTDSTKVRIETGSFGLGDVRFTLNRWMLDTYEHDKGNFSLGLGIKLPTGKYNAMDTFQYKGEDYTDVYREVDQSIQLGDGGFGFSVESQGFMEFVSNTLYGYYTLFYLFNPKDTTDAATYRSNPFEQHMSVPDQFLVRGGISYFPSFVKGLGISAGVRYEGIPVHDLIGETDGFRRPGYIINVDPGLTYQNGPHQFTLNVPIAVYRNRTRSVADENWTDLLATDADPSNDVYKHGDAAFADYTVFLTYTFRLYRHKMDEHAPGSENDYIK
ncbi:MAG: hypothetical protein R2794_02870 [Chitinophagales bacterium]